ncbi:MAG: dTDP-glucose 4,6-dehydratase [Nitrospirales bacterium]|nr:dTDP-glucose 4,6-dehydratase [Nitrospira sp.]MDR4502121.1 dTDP-glucose 4,6-dehydratase [Nitrospirales bacterium]
MQTIFVTGGAGFIGSNFVTWLLARPNLKIVIIDKLTYAGHMLNLQDVLGLPSVSFIQADIADRSTLDRLFTEHSPDVVLNFAAESHVDRSIDNPAPFIETNTVGTFVLLEAARHFWMTLTTEKKARFRFLHVSTDEVYGTLGAEGLFSEETPYAPNSPYAASKAAADHFVRAYFHTYGFPTITTNCSNNYGPYQFPEKLIPLMILNALEGKALPIYGDGRHVRDWLFVEDHCEGLWMVACQGKPGEKYNLGGNNELSNLELVNLLIDVLEEFEPAHENQPLHRQGIAAYKDLKVFVDDRPGHDRRYAIDASKVKAELGWAPKFTLLTGLRKTVQWYLSHRNWCEAVLAENYGRERLGLKN